MNNNLIIGERVVLSTHSWWLTGGSDYDNPTNVIGKVTGVTNGNSESLVHVDWGSRHRNVYRGIDSDLISLDNQPNKSMALSLRMCLVDVNHIDLEMQIEANTNGTYSIRENLN